MLISKFSVRCSNFKEQRMLNFEQRMLNRKTPSPDGSGILLRSLRSKRYSGQQENAPKKIINCQLIIGTFPPALPVSPSQPFYSRGQFLREIYQSSEPGFQPFR